MSQQYPKSGFGYVAEYQVSGIPYATASTITTGSAPVQIPFEFVTRFVTIKNVGGPLPYSGTLAVGFTSNGVQGSNKFTLPPSSSYTGEWRLKDLFLQAQGGSVSYEVYAGLTMIERRQMPTLTGSAAAGVVSASSNLSIWGATGMG